MANTDKKNSDIIIVEILTYYGLMTSKKINIVLDSPCFTHYWSCHEKMTIINRQQSQKSIKYEILFIMFNVI